MTPRTRRVAPLLSILAIVGTAVAAGDAEGEKVVPTFTAPLPNVPGSSLGSVVVEYAPGGRGVAHHHAGSVYAYVLDGAIRSQLDDGPVRVYRAGESFFEPPGTHHRVGENASATEPARLLAVFVAPTGAVLTHE